LISRLAIPFSLITLIVIGITRIQPGDALEIDAYHDSVAEIINSIPVDVNGWVGQQIPLPQSATNLLRPNALIARHYVNEEKGISATLMLIHCRDIRDLAGHYPPRCYPANGWMESSVTGVGMTTIGDQSLRRYGFTRVAGQVERAITVYSLFALPNGEITTSMKDVRRLSASYEFRKYGAAQLQVVIDGAFDQKDHSWILQEMYEIAEPTIETVISAQQEHEQGEGSVL
jgi:hypothetical protein